ncbi:MAG: NTP/NDP exchange transporter [Sandaracinaceae bacterium]
MDEAKDKALSPLDRALGLITEVRGGEGGTALLLTLSIFLLLMAYYVIKPVREALILAMESGAEYKSYMGGAIAVALLFAVPAYSAFAKRVPRNRLVVSVTLFFASNLVLFFVASQFEATRVWMGLGFYLWVGIFNMMVIAQAWAFAADVYTEDQGKRLFALIGVGASFGSAFGSLVGVQLAESLGVYQMLLVAAGLLVAIAWLFQVIHRRVSRTGEGAEPVVPEDDDVPLAKGEKAENLESDQGPFEMVFKHRYLRLIAVFSVAFTLVNTNGEYMLSVLVSDFAEATELAGNLPEGMSRGDFIGAFYSDFFLYVNILGAVIQLFLVSRIVKFGGIHVAFAILPIVALIDATLIGIVPALAIVRIGKIAENSIDYSVNNTVRNMLWLPTTQEMKYRAKQAIDTFFVRMGDVGSAVLVGVGAGMLGLGVRSFAFINLAVVAVWIPVVVLILRERKRMLGLQETESEAEPT